MTLFTQVKKMIVLCLSSKQMRDIVVMQYYTHTGEGKKPPVYASHYSFIFFLILF